MRRLAVMLWVLGVLPLAALGQTPEVKERFPLDLAISPDGTKIAVLEQLQDADRKPVGHELWVMNADGTDARALTRGHEDRSPHFSPDGTRLVFSRFKPGETDLWMVGTDGSGLTRLTETPRAETQPRFTLDGKGVLFIRSGGLFEGGEARMLNLADRGERLLLGKEWDPRQVSEITSTTWWVLCKRPGADEKVDATLLGSYVVADVSATGRVVPMIHLAKDSKLEIRSFAVSPSNTIVELVEGFRSTPYLAKPGTLTELDPPNLQDITRDGKLTVGRGLDTKLKWHILLYNLETRKGTRVSPRSPEHPEPPLGPEDFVKGLHQLIAAAPEDFKSIRRGEPEKSSFGFVAYNASVRLPEVDRVSLFIPEPADKNKVPRAWAQLFSGRSEAALEFYRRTAGEMTAALPGWAAAETLRTLQPTRYVSRRFRRDGMPVLVELEVTLNDTLDFGSVGLRVTKPGPGD